MKLALILVVTLGIVSCQSFGPEQKDSSRSLASSNPLRLFLTEISERSQQYSRKQLERKILEYIKKKETSLTRGNWSQIGITDSEASQIKTLYDDLPQMPAVRSWVMENITLIVRIDRKIAKEAFDLVNNGHIVYKNPYKAKSINNRIANQRNSKFEFTSIDTANTKVLNLLEDLAKTKSKISRGYRKLLLGFQKKAKREPAAFVNGMKSVESAAHVTRKTGRKYGGKGCPKFNEDASAEILAYKRRVDEQAAENIAKRSQLKAGKEFDNYKEIPEEARLTQDEIDVEVIRAFEDVLNYTNKEARTAYKRLKSPPCNVY